MGFAFKEASTNFPAFVWSSRNGDADDFTDAVKRYLNQIGYSRLDSRSEQQDIANQIYAVAGDQLKETAMMAIQSVV